MLKKTVYPVRIKEKVWGSRTEYRLFGLLIFKKTVTPPPANEFEWFR